eukprot:TRINITY_DN495_c0_g1_i2.p1 TRINITY_DN495_c0_g1~~TRINITY_DN495_c0_g1_i2.p1  ORF type:complete len:176 (-),score=17.43 TRINITY_DN495_c0_g1_i2:474-1001(-)
MDYDLNLLLIFNQDQSRHRWTLQIQTANGKPVSDYIKKVIYELHPTFDLPEVEVTRPPFELVRRGWGTFEVKATIFLRRPWNTVITAYHYLQFTRNGGRTPFVVDLDVKRATQPPPPPRVYSRGRQMQRPAAAAPSHNPSDVRRHQSVSRMQAPGGPHRQQRAASLSRPEAAPWY